MLVGMHMAIRGDETAVLTCDEHDAGASYRLEAVQRRRLGAVSCLVAHDYFPPRRCAVAPEIIVRQGAGHRLAHQLQRPVVEKALSKAEAVE